MKIKKFLKFNKYTFLFLIIWFICGVGVTYSYYAYNYEEESVIIGSVADINIDLDVELVVGNNDGMVPLNGEALSNALNGVGSDNGACIDNLGNLSCQVYKITLINYGNKVKHVNGTIELFAKDGEANVYNNLKWIELEDPTTIKSNVFANGMSKSTLVQNLTIQPKAVGIWYIAVWIDEINGDQLSLDKGDFGGIVKFESDIFVGDGLVENLLERNAENDIYLDFSKTSSESGTNGVYVKSDTTEEGYPIYYWRGSVNNNLIFANTCWKMVRTTKTGGLKLLYNGVPTDGICNNTGDATIIGKSKFNSTTNSLAHTGYMYSNPYVSTSKTMSNIKDTYYYGNSVTYSNGNYTLENTISSSSWSSIYNGGLNNNHYTCFSTSTTCDNGEVYYIYYTNSTKAYYITLTNNKRIENAIVDMLGADDENMDNYNTISSTVKGNKDAAGSIDHWYYNNILVPGYSSYLEDTVWCTDRRILSKAGWDPNGGNTLTYMTFEALNTQYTTHVPSLECARKVDSFTADDTVNGNGKLDYPIGLLTPDEIMLAGGKGGVANDDYYLYSEGNYWSSAPNNFYNNKIVQVYVNSNGLLNGSHIDATSIGIRPAISLSHGYVISSGDGSTDKPYIIDAAPIIEEENDSAT